MSQPRVTLLASQHRLLREHFASSGDKEHAAVALFRRIRSAVSGLPDSDRYVCVAIHPFEEEWITGRSSSHFAFRMAPLREFFRRCEEESLVFGFVHNHPTGFADFSDADDTNETTLLQALSNRNGRNVSFVALLWVEGRWRARVRNAERPLETQTARHVTVTDRPLQVYLAQRDEMRSEAYARQAAAFGMPLVQSLQGMRIAVVGAGGTGSPTATLLARSGVGELVLIDPDTLEASNLNRVRGARLSDVGKNKAELLSSYITTLGLQTKVGAVTALVDSDIGVDAIAGCDFVFGCTDDQIGREILNAAAYAYAQPYVDVGLGGQVAVGPEGLSRLRYHYGRVSTILPEEGECLFCQGALRDQWIRREYALREKPEMSAGEARERYLEGGAEQAPGVGPFTSATADFGVATLFDLIVPFRKFPPELRWDAFSIDFVKMALSSAQQRADAACPYCSTHSFLVMQEKARLNRPALGTRDVAL